MKLSAFLFISSLTVTVGASPISPRVEWVTEGLAKPQPLSAKKVSPISLTDTLGVKRRVPDPKSKLTILIFLANDCPISNTYAPEIDRIARAYREKNCATYLVYPLPDISRAAAEKHRTEYRHSATGLLDTDQRLARASGANITPEAVLLDSKGKRLYVGRIDDRHVDFGVSRPEAKRRDLREALDEALGGKAVSVAQTKAVGCFIPWKSK